MGLNFFKLPRIMFNKSRCHNTIFQLENGAQQDPVSICLFVLSLEILFAIVKNNKDIKSLKVLGNNFSYTVYASDTIFFLKNLGSVKKLRNTNSLFSWFSGLKRNLSKCEVGGIGLLKEGKVTVCGIKYVALTKDAKKILGIFFCVIKISN